MPRSAWIYIKKRLFIPCVTLVALLPASSYAQETIRIGGTGAALGTMKALASAFEQSHPAVKTVIVPSLGSGGAIKALSKDALEIGISGRPLKSEEAGLGLSAVEYADTPFVPVVHKKVAASGITTADIVKIYTGEMQAWPKGERIRPVLRPATDVDTVLVRNISLEMDKAVDAVFTREGMLSALTDQQNAEVLEKTPGSFGFSTLTQIATENLELKVLSLDGVRPSLKTLMNGSYPLTKKLFLVTKGTQPPVVREFVQFIFSPRGGSILKQTENLPVTGARGK
ncbi:MAG TPA: substrate-binding domain-containing protein [Nitrospirota bacterium]